jgi:hypothetical protein
MDIGYAVCVDSSDDVFVGGSFNSNVNFAADWGGSDSHDSADNDDAFVTKISH